MVAEAFRRDSKSAPALLTCSAEAAKPLKTASFALHWLRRKLFGDWMLRGAVPEARPKEDGGVEDRALRSISLSQEEAQEAATKAPASAKQAAAFSIFTPLSLLLPTPKGAGNFRLLGGMYKLPAEVPDMEDKELEDEHEANADEPEVELCKRRAFFWPKKNSA